MKTTYTIIIALVIVIIAVGAIAYVFLSKPGSPTLQSTVLNGAGATFPQPFLNATITTYTTQIRTNVQINYQGVGSGQGVQSLTSKTVDFACSDAPLTASQREAAPNALHIPETIGAITVAYNLPGISSGLKLTGTVLADIYLGTITNWNDPAITALNPDTNLAKPRHNNRPQIRRLRNNKLVHQIPSH